VASKFKYEPFVRVGAMSSDDARDFVVREFGVDPARIYLIKDGGPANPERYKPGARVWHVYIGKKPVGGHLYRVKENPRYEKGFPIGHHQIIVDKLGVVYDGRDEIEAGAKYGEYIALSMSGDGYRVIWLVDGEVEDQYIPELEEEIKLAWWDEHIKKNPYTPPSLKWPVYEYKISPAWGYRVKSGDPDEWQIWELEKRPGERAKIRIVGGEQPRSIHGNREPLWKVKHRAIDRAIDLAIRHATNMDPRNPNPIRILDESGRCYSVVRPAYRGAATIDECDPPARPNPSK